MTDINRVLKDKTSRVMMVNGEPVSLGPNMTLEDYLELKMSYDLNRWIKDKRHD